MIGNSMTDMYRLWVSWRVRRDMQNNVPPPNPDPHDELLRQHLGTAGPAVRVYPPPTELG
jgi:hypothetical protein